MRGALLAMLLASGCEAPFIACTGPKPIGCRADCAAACAQLGDGGLDVLQWSPDCEAWCWDFREPLPKGVTP